MSIYARRPKPEEGRGQRPGSLHLAPPVQDGYDQCVLEAVVTVDAKGRVPWTFGSSAPSLKVGSVTALGEGLVEVTLTDAAGNPAWSVDARGRLQLRRGVLQAAALAPGDRLAVVRGADPRTILLTRTDRLAVRRQAAG